MLLVLVAASCFALSAASPYISCTPGTSNIILAAPHGGDLQPTDIPDRDAGCWSDALNDCVWSHNCGSPDTNRCGATTVKDLYTQELTNKLREELFNLFGEYPTVAINLLHRIKLDANRDIGEAAFGVPAAEEAWLAFQQCLDDARQVIEDSGMRGIFYDIHGHGHSIQRAELGYLISGADLDSGSPIDPTTTSIRGLAAGMTPANFERLLRGDLSFGAALEAEGFPAVPSPTDAGPDGNSYFSGGYNTERHGSVGGGAVDGIQIESARDARDEWETVYGAALARAIQSFVNAHYQRQ